jgi:hypothetical protein
MTNRNGLVLSLACLSMLLGVGVCQADSITYNVDQVIGSGSVVGTITTDGTIGILGAGDITGWNLELNGLGASTNLTNSNSGVVDTGADVTATSTNLFFNFSGGDTSILAFVVTRGAGTVYYCDATSSGECLQGASVSPISFSDPSFQNEAESGNQIIGSTPLPSTWLMLLSGFVGLGFFAFRGTTKNFAAVAAA